MNKEVEKKFAKIFSKNLKRLAYDNGKKQVDMAKDLNISKATISSWMNGTRVPRMETIDLLCDYFHCKRTDIMEDYKPKPSFTFDDPTQDAIISLSADKGWHILTIGYEKLNDAGRERLLSCLEDLLEVERYTEKRLSDSKIG